MPKEESSKDKLRVNKGSASGFKQQSGIRTRKSILEDENNPFLATMTCEERMRESNPFTATIPYDALLKQVAEGSRPAKQTPKRQSEKKNGRKRIRYEKPPPSANNYQRKFFPFSLKPSTQFLIMAGIIAVLGIGGRQLKKSLFST